MKEIIVIGGGPSGIFASIFSKNKNTKVTLLERNNKIGRKLAITGKGRCNLTNSRDISEFFDEFNRNSNFCYSSLYSFTNIDLISFFESRNLKMKTERGGRVFPVSDNAFDVVDKLRDSLLKKDINIVTNTYVYSIDKKDKFIVKTNNGIYRSDSLIIATGGASYPTTGSDGNGYCLASNFGHNIIDIKPALVAIDLNDEWTSDMAGISLKNIELKLFKDKKLIRTEFGELIFTHSGISGPTVLRMSSHMDNNLNYSLSIDLKPGLDFQSLDSRIQKDFIKYNNKDFKNSLFDLTIKAMIPLIINQANIDEHKVINQITKSERHRLVEVFKNFKLNYKGLKDIKYGIVSRGGLCVDEINPSTMESKIIDNLYFSGEILDVDANTGGYNLQFAFSSGYLAGINCGGI